MILQYWHLVWQSPPWSEWEEVQRFAHCKSNLPMQSERPSSQNYTKLIKFFSGAFLFTSLPSDLNKKVWFPPKMNLNFPSLPFLWATCTKNCSRFYHFQMQTPFSCKLQERWTWILPSLPFLWATPRRMFLSMLIKNRGLVDITSKIPWSLFAKK